jgi:hypothetical protein
MGCFSFICKECGKAILSNSFSGQMTKDDPNQGWGDEGEYMDNDEVYE